MSYLSVTLDPGQQKAGLQFTALAQALNVSTLRRLFKPYPKGIYCFGPVGRGKTLLMDLFFQQLTVPKTRLHFHAFMQQIHTKLHALQGQKNPLWQIAKEWANQTKVLCLDEMMVDDVADAMILAELFTALHKEKVILVMTSNTAPDNLYKNGVQRERFLPAIALIKRNMQLVNIGEGEDYRRKILSESGTFFTPLTTENAQKMQKEFSLLTHDVYQTNQILHINDHAFTPVYCSAHIAWFTFDELCKKPRAYTDYLILSAQFKVIFLSDMPILHAKDDAAARRFVHLIDILYDNKNTLVLSAAAPIADLYQGQHLKTEFARTQSRLFEMRFNG
jgi:cell division protein ZapE